jgi:hypothetical protein
MLRVLAAGHVAFDIMEAWCVSEQNTPRRLEDYKLVLLAGAASLSDAACERIDAFVRNGGKVLATAGTSTRDEMGAPKNRFRLKAAGVKREFKIHEKSRGTYLRIFPEDKIALGEPDSLADLDILYVRGDFLEFSIEPGTIGHLGLIPSAMYGPPEKCYYTEVTRIPGLIVNDFGKGRFAYLPWPLGTMYEHRSHHGHRALVMTVVKNALNYRPQIEIVASPLVEVTHQSARDGSFEWIGLANHSGQLGTAFHAPVPIRDLKVLYRGARMPRSTRLLRLDQTIRARVTTDAALLINIPELNDFEVVALEW